MFKIFKGKRIKKEKKKKTLRGADELFPSGDIFKANNKELDNMMKELSTKPVPNEIVRHREIIRAITVLTIKNNRYTKRIQNFNFALSVLLILLSIFTINLARKQLAVAEKQTYYTEVSTRDEHINQAQSMQRALKHCEENPESTESGLIYTESGRPASCSEILNSPLLEKYKN